MNRRPSMTMGIVLLGGLALTPPTAAQAPAPAPYLSVHIDEIEPADEPAY